MTTRAQAYTDGSASALRRRGYLGMSLARRPLTGGGVRVLQVDVGAGAHAAGVRVDDVLLALNGQPVHSAGDVATAVARGRAGDPMTVEIDRGGATMTLGAQLTALPTEPLRHGELKLVEISCRGGRRRGLLSEPHGDEQAPLVMLLQSSDWGSFEHPLLPEHPITRLVDELSRLALGTFRLERSGVGDSEGPPVSEQDCASELQDHVSALRWLAQRIGARQLILFGDSLGGMLAPLLAQRTDVAAVAVIGTTASGWHQSTLDAFTRQQQRAGSAAAELEQALEQLTQLQQYVFCDGLTPAQAYLRYPQLASDRFPWLADDRAYGRVVTFFQQLQQYDLLAAWSRLSVPVLALHGADDWICTFADAETIAQAAHGGLSPTATSLDLPGVDHGWRNAGAVERVAASLANWCRTLPRPPAL